jgi:hypothetical protein
VTYERAIPVNRESGYVRRRALNVSQSRLRATSWRSRRNMAVQPGMFRGSLPFLTDLAVFAVDDEFATFSLRELATLVDRFGLSAEAVVLRAVNFERPVACARHNVYVCHSSLLRSLPLRYPPGGGLSGPRQVGA